MAINLVMAGCKPEYAPVVRVALLALTQPAFNLNGVQATTHMAPPFLIMTGPESHRIGMNGVNAFGSGNPPMQRSAARSVSSCSIDGTCYL